ncbi:EAL domain-containing protein [Pseudomonas aeruginosa]
MDQSFVRDLTQNSGDAAIIRAIIAMAHSLDLKVVAEGVSHRTAGLPGGPALRRAAGLPDRPAVAGPCPWRKVCARLVERDPAGML